MKDFSNRYIIIFSVVMVVSVAIILSLMALLLQLVTENNDLSRAPGKRPR